MPSPCAHSGDETARILGTGINGQNRHAGFGQDRHAGFGQDCHAGFGPCSVRPCYIKIGYTDRLIGYTDRKREARGVVHERSIRAVREYSL
jgi:hypothetical protein